MPLQATSGAASYDAFGGGVPVVPEYIEDMFSTYLYTGTGAAQTITNGIDLSGKGGLVWIKRRNASGDNILTVTGNGLNLSSNLTTDFINDGAPLFNSSGFDLVYGTSYLNASGGTYASWTFREQKKFFDIVTYTGNGANRTIAHNLGSEPGCIIIKSTNRNSTNWAVYHRSLANTQYLALNTSAGASTGATWWNSTTPTSAVFSLGTSADVNNSGGATYVAYLFAHNAGGFGLTGTDNAISCGTFTTDGTGKVAVNLGYEPQWLLMKATDESSWLLFDNMRNWSKSGYDELNPNLSAGESNYTSTNFSPTATGFQLFGNEYGTSRTFIYIAIRRGPMKVPTSGTSVFSPVSQTGGGTVTTNFPVDLSISTVRPAGSSRSVMDRLRGSSTASYRALYTNGSSSEDVGTGGGLGFDNNTGYIDVWYSATYTDIYWNWRRAPSFFDVVCYTGTGTAGQTYTHNLGVTPELMIVKARETANPWIVWQKDSPEYYLQLQATDAANNDNTKFYFGNNTVVVSPTSTVFTVGSTSTVNSNGYKFVIYLFATCPGVSKVGSYTGNGSTQTIDCGFTGGARFVLIKRTDSTSGWYVYDTARGMTVLTDPYLFLNGDTAETATLGSVTTVSTGFALDSTILAAINVSAASYIFLAIA